MSLLAEKDVETGKYLILFYKFLFISGFSYLRDIKDKAVPSA
jgi:hypothetical protein